MSVDPLPIGGAAPPAPGDARLRDAIDDLFVADEARLPDRTRAGVDRLLAATVDAVEREVRAHAARLLADRGAPAVADAMLSGRPVLPRLSRGRVLRDLELMEELIGRVELDRIGRAQHLLHSRAAPEPDRPSLLPRLVDAPDAAVADAARALLVAESRRGDAAELRAMGSDLPTELHERLTWWVVAAVREQGGHDRDRDRALAEAAARTLAAHDERGRPEAAAMRLAVAVDARPDELPALLAEALGDGRTVLFTALLARAAPVDYERAREAVVDPRGDLLVLLLHAVGLDRAAASRIGVALAAADGRRDLQGLADAVERASPLDRDGVRAALTPLFLRRDLRAAVRRLAGRR